MNYNAGLAQLAERLSSKRRVRGSSPLLGTIFTAIVLSCSIAAPADAAKHDSSKPKAQASAKKSGVKKAAVAKTPTSKTSAKKKPADKASPAPKERAAKGKKPEVAKDSPAKLKKGSKAAKGSKREATLPAEAQERVVPVRAEPKVVLEKGPTPVRTEQGCSTTDGGLSAVGQIMKSGGKAFRCQKTWDVAEGKMVGYPAWVEVFMPTPGWGAGLRETAPPPTTVAAPSVPGAASKVGPLRDTQEPAPKDEPATEPDSMSNQLF